MNRRVDRHNVLPLVLDSFITPLSAMGGTVVHNPKHPRRRPIGFLGHHMLYQAVEGNNAGGFPRNARRSWLGARPMLPSTPRLLSSRTRVLPASACPALSARWDACAAVPGCWSSRPWTARSRPRSVVFLPRCLRTNPGCALPFRQIEDLSEKSRRAGTKVGSHLRIASARV